MRAPIARALVGLFLVYAGFNATVGALMRSKLAEVESQLGAAPSTFEVRSSDLCTLLTGEGFRQRLQALLFPWAAAKASALRERWSFTAEPSAGGVTCAPRSLRHVLHAAPR